MERLGYEFAVGFMEDRYRRNILVEGIGAEGQAKLRAARALVIGAGGLGSPVLFYLAAAGVGTIGIVDDDVVHITNLQRQILHFTDDLEQWKTTSAQQKLAALNPDVKTVTYNCRLTQENAVKMIDGGYDFIIDCCDNFATKLLINDVCVQLRKPFSHGAVTAMRGEVMTYVPGSACYRCVFDTLPEDGLLPATASTGILGPVAGIVGSLQATETIKYFTGMNDLIINRILITDAKTMNFVSLRIKKRESCLCEIS